MTLTTSPPVPQRRRRRHPLRDARRGEGTDPAIAKFQFRARNTWQSGTHSRVGVSPTSPAPCRRWQHKNVTVVESDHPEVLVGTDNAPTPVEYLLHAHRRLPDLRHREHRLRPRRHLTHVSSTVEGDIDLLGILGLSDARSATATSSSRSPSTSRATPTTRRCARSSSSRAAARPSTTR